MLSQRLLSTGAEGTISGVDTVVMTLVALHAAGEMSQVCSPLRLL